MEGKRQWQRRWWPLPTRPRRPSSTRPSKQRTAGGAPLADAASSLTFADEQDDFKKGMQQRQEQQEQQQGASALPRYPEIEVDFMRETRWFVWRPVLVDFVHRRQRAERQTKRTRATSGYQQQQPPLPLPPPSGGKKRGSGWLGGMATGAGNNRGVGVGVGAKPKRSYEWSKPKPRPPVELNDCLRFYTEETLLDGDNQWYVECVE